MRLSKREYYVHSNYNDGYCSYCNLITNEGGVEPDAKGYECNDCGNNTVMGIEMAFITDAIAIKENANNHDISEDEKGFYDEHDDEYGV